MNNYEYLKKVNAIMEDKYNDPIAKYYRSINRLWWISISCLVVSFLLIIISLIM